MKLYKWALRAITVAICITSILQARNTYAQSTTPFTIYGLIVYKSALEGGGSNSPASQELVEMSGIHKINLIYERRLLDVDEAKPSASKIDINKIDAVAKLTLAEPNVPVSLDIESWDRFDKNNTPALYLKVIDAFKKVNPKSKLGFYAIVPQVTFGWAPGTKEKYDLLNAAYRSVAASVDYYSPSLYNWKNALDDKSWKQSAAYAISVARAFDPTKPILPYITPQVARGGKNGTVTFLSYDQMMFRLRTLKALGANGCIIWTGSAGIKAGATFDPSTGWAKAVVDFQHQ